MNNQDINENILEVKLRINTLENNIVIKRYKELSNSFDCIRYIYLIEMYINGDDNTRNLIKDDIRYLELYNNNVKEYISLYKNELVTNYLHLNELLLSLDMKQQEKSR